VQLVLAAQLDHVEPLVLAAPPARWVFAAQLDHVEPLVLAVPLE